MSTYEYGVQQYRPQQEFGFQEFEEEGQYEGQYEGEFPGEYEEEFGAAQEAPFGETGAGQYEAGYQGEYESPLNEADEINLASQLLEVTNEEELEQFLGNLLRRVSRGVGGFMRSGVGRAVGGILKNVARTALPVVGGAVGTFVAPGVGTALGSQLGTMASRLFEMELEGMDREEQEFEVARRVVRLSAGAARNAAMAPRGADPYRVARRAVLSAARRHAPGVARSFRRYGRPARWYWPRPVPYGGYGAPAGSGAPAGYDAGAAAGYDRGEPEPWEEPADGEPGTPNGAQPAMETGDMGGNGHRPRSGRWIMRGRKLIVLGI